MIPLRPWTAIAITEEKKGGVNMKINVFNNQHLILEIVDDDSGENRTVRQEIDLLTHAVKRLSERVN